MAGGRPTEYKQEFADQAKKLCELGATDEEIANFFGVSARTVYRWKHEHEEFCQALKIGKAPADNRVERSLFQKATGFYYTEQQAFKIKKGQHEEVIKIVEVEKFAMPDTTAQIYWTKNRQSDHWKDKTEQALTVDHNMPASDKVKAMVNHVAERSGEAGKPPAS